MDLGTIGTRLARESYYVGPAAVDLFAADCRLVFNNCKEFNAEGSDIWVIADEMLKSFEKWLYDWILCPSAWLTLEHTGDKSLDVDLKAEFREEGEDSYDLWSPWETGCTICQSNDNSEELLLCDRCDGEIHMGCSTPEITTLPVGEWYCSFCTVRNKFEVDAAAKKASIEQSEVQIKAPAEGQAEKKAVPIKPIDTAPVLPNVLSRSIEGEKKFNRKATGKSPSATAKDAVVGNSSANHRATFFLVKWIGMSVRYSTWERPEDIGDDEQIQRYFKFSRIPTPKEISESTCQLPCCAKRNRLLLNNAARKVCEKDRFCTLGWEHPGECSREIKTLDKAYGSKEYRQLRMVEQVKAQLFAFHCLLNNHTPDKDVLKQCGVFTNAYVCKKQYLSGVAKPQEDDEDYSEDGSASESSDDDEEEEDEGMLRGFRPLAPVYPGMVDTENENDGGDDLLFKKKTEDEVTDVLSSLVEHVALGYPTALERVVPRVQFNSVYPANIYKDLPTFTEFSVALRRTPFGLGMRLGVGDDGNATVLGFQDLPSGTIGPAEASQVISIGDGLVAVNHVTVAGMSFKDVIGMIGRSMDFILFHFHSRRPAFMYPPYCQARQVTRNIENALENAAEATDFIPYSYNAFKPVLKVGISSSEQSVASAEVLAAHSNYMAPSGPMQHLYAGIVDNSIDPHEHFASFLPEKSKSGDKSKADASEKNEFIPYEQSPTFKGGRTLRAYQVEGLNWMVSCFKAQRSCILADEMGLGKTVQVVSFIEHLKSEESIRGPYLIVVPLSTIGHWRREIESWTDLNVCVYHDIGDRSSKFTAKDMRSIIRDTEWYYPGLGNSIFKFHILLTTFETVLADFEEFEHIHWRLVVVDEAHRLKSAGSRVLKQMRVLHCDRKLLLTGTPLQNNTQELWVLLNYLEPVKFDSLEQFNANFGTLRSQEQVEELQKLLGPYILRRVKEDVEKSIPPKEETIIAVELTTLQKQYYRAIYDKNKSFLYRGTKNGLPTLNNIQLQLRKCCNHPFLIKGVEDRELEELGHHPSPADVMEKTITSSGKFVLVSKLLPKLKREGHKVLIFSQFLKQLDLLERYCEFNGFGYERLDGSTGGSVRQNSIDRFSRPNSKSFVFLLSTKAGGVGINLIAADTVIIFDSDWNPQNDLQAQARCHRIGQKKSVQIYRLVTRNTYESEMFDRASQKLGLEHAVLGTASFSETAQIEKPSAEQLVELLKRGAYALMEDDDTASKQFAERDIETILKENARVLVVNQATVDKSEDGTDESIVSQHKSPMKGPKRKSLGGMAVDRSSFVAEGSTGELSVDDPNFWEKVLPGAVSVEMLSVKLEDGSAISSRQSKIKFISNLDIALSELAAEMKNPSEDSNKSASNLTHEYDIAIQVLHAVTTKYKKEFSTEQLDLVKGYLFKLEKSRTRSCRLPTKREEPSVVENGSSNKRRKLKLAAYAHGGSESEDDVESHDEDDDDSELESGKGRSKKKTKRGGVKKETQSPKAKGSSKKRKAPTTAFDTAAAFSGGVINDSDDLCTLCGDGGLILLCDGPCHRSFHLECIGMKTEPEDEHWLCPDCAVGRHMCLICKQVGDMGVEFGVIQCSMAKCGRFYHKGCLAKHPRVEWVGKKRFRCPSHFCHGCPQEQQTRTNHKKKMPVISCIHCAQSFHAKCITSSEQFIRLSTNLMICASHLRAKKPAANGATEQVADTKSASSGSTNAEAEKMTKAKEPERKPSESASKANPQSNIKKETDQQTLGKRDRDSEAETEEKLCAFCHTGEEVVSETKTETNSTAKVIEGPFIEDPIRLQFSDKSVEMVYTHLNCALHSPEVYVKSNGTFCNLARAIKRGRQLRCTACKQLGATVGCVVDKCRSNFHLRCAFESGGECMDTPYSMYCKTHADAKRVEPKTFCVCGIEDENDEGLSLSCDSCSSKYHPKCVNMSSRQMSRRSKDAWLCKQCVEGKSVCCWFMFLCVDLRSSNLLFML